MIYVSALKFLHFKRIIVDEGHSFCNNSSVAVSVANNLITADHRWIISGTPAKDLLGVEMDLSLVEDQPFLGAENSVYILDWLVCRDRGVECHSPLFSSRYDVMVPSIVRERESVPMWSAVRSPDWVQPC